MFEIKEYYKVDKGHVLGTFTVMIPKWGNFLIKNMVHMKKEKMEWVSFPSKQYENKGEKKYYTLNGFESMEVSRSFLDKVLQCLRDHLNEPDKKYQYPEQDLLNDRNKMESLHKNGIGS